MSPQGRVTMMVVAACYLYCPLGLKHVHQYFRGQCGSPLYRYGADFLERPFCSIDHRNPKNERISRDCSAPPPSPSPSLAGRMGLLGGRLKDDWERGGGTLGPIGEGGEGYRISTHIQDRSDEKRKPPRRLLKLFWLFSN